MIPAFCVFIGGIAGAISRFELGNRLNKRSIIPWGTAAANFTGGLLLGALFHYHQEVVLPNWLWLLLGTGFCGGYTTYSTFSYETFSLMKQGKLGMAAGYLLGSILITLLGVAVIGLLI
ncbi:fluoride efflux transporter CrcB [Halobacillus salinarum]|uniref:Fluoride-specific ion channel FluC n=1 Tax=Halobacillus salinarum TaxID=2932257 RepID=A0ABY4ENH9_9BACI|nr:fluoride efflux transporter CrcB [Halobacillus salinarum]UOQ46011.1 fluoride efflux transporter CrcB [Halobacillus salinarum]